MIGLIIGILLIIGFLVGLVFLQIKLSRSSNKWLGLIPSLTIFLLSLTIIVVFVPYTTQVSTSTSSGEVLETYTTNDADGYVVMITEETRIQIFLHMITLIVTFDWPIIILLSIHFIIRNRRSRRTEFDRMHIQDL